MCSSDLGFKLSVVMTCLQAGPNNQGRFHKVTVEKDEVEKFYDGPVGECAGPDWTIHIGGGLTTARFAWKDEFSEQIKRSFEVGGPIPETLLVNRDDVNAVAKAAAGRLYSILLDR